MFSCCALFNTDDNEKDDMEHLKALEELEMEAMVPPSNELSMTVEDEDGVDAKELNIEGTPMTASLEMSTGTVEAPKSASLEEEPMVEGDTLEMKLEAETVLLAQQHQEQQRQHEKVATVNEGAFFANERADLEAAAATAISIDDEVSKAEDAGKSEMVTADSNVGTGGAEIADETLRALREAEDAAHAAAAEAEKRRFEEEASARAARQAESEARKALWRAEEAQRMKEKAGSSAPSEATVTTAVVKGEAAPVASREEEAARSTEAAREYVTAQLLNVKGLRLQKHGRNGKSTYRKLTSPDGDCRTISWGKESHDLKTMQEARKGTDDDPDYPGFKGTSELRKSKTASVVMDRSFSLIFSSRSLDFTAASTEECDTLIQGFQALSAKAQQG